MNENQLTKEEFIINQLSQEVSSLKMQLLSVAYDLELAKQNSKESEQEGREED